MDGTWIVVPCYNEADRLPRPAFRRFLREPHGVRFLMVNDGSRDATLERLEELAAEFPDRLEVLDLAANGGKAEAVRQGCLAGFARNAKRIGYWDADLAAPLEAIPQFETALEADPARQLVLGARVRLLGRSIRRNPLRHYLGRVFATAASLVLRLPVYDTQCGAKLFRATPAMHAVFVEPFLSRWLFDVEILARLIRDARKRGATADEVEASLCELPLQQWHDVAGSRVRPADFVKAVYELGRIHRRYLAGWRAPRPSSSADAAPPARGAAGLPRGAATQRPPRPKFLGVAKERPHPGAAQPTEPDAR